MKKLIVRLYDDDGYDYPLLEVEAQDFDEVKKVLEEYKKECSDDYNFEDFAILLQKKELLIRTITPEELQF